jgi:hypothetical protein
MSGHPVPSILSEKATFGLRNLLRDIAVGGGPGIKHFAASSAELRPKWADALAHRKDIFANIVQTARQHLHPAERAGIQTAFMSGDRGPFRDIMAHLCRQEQLRRFFCRLSESAASALSSQRSASALRLILLRMYAVEWASRGGYETVKPELVANDFSDLEFILTALFADEFVTRDRRAFQRYEDAKAVAARVWPAEADLFA